MCKNVGGNKKFPGEKVPYVTSGNKALWVGTWDGLGKMMNNI